MRITQCHFIILACLAAFVTSTCSHVSLSLKDIEGRWTRQQYVETVRSTHSPFAGSPETVEIENAKFTWINYHEGFWRKIVSIKKDTTKGIYRLVLGEPEKDPPGSELIDVPFRPVINRDGKVEAMTFLNDAAVFSKQELFVRISIPLEQLIGQIVLAGSYRDETGKSYVFDKSGKAIWPGRSFTYQVALDSSEAHCDYFLVDYDKNPVNTKKYGFKWVNGKTELFNLKDKDYIECEEQPFAILTPQVQ
jgi:hypothetical protein